MINEFLSRLRAAVSGAAIVAAAKPGDAVETGYLVAAATAEGTALQRIHLLPMGTFRLRDGRGPFVVESIEHANAIVAASLKYAGRRDIPIDYDHQMVHAIGPGKAGTAIASGWIKGLTADADGVHADVEWTAAAAAKLADREYRYISPVFTASAAGRISSIRNAGLVNDNAIDELVAVAATQENIVDYSPIAAALGLDSAASLDAILAAIGAAAMPKATMTAAATALGLAADASGDMIVAAASTAAAAALAPDPAKFVPAEQLVAASTRLAVLEGLQRDAVIAAASEAGKLTPAMADWARGHFGENAAALETYIAALPVVVAAGALQGGKIGSDEPLTGGALVTAASQHIAEQAGKGIAITPDAAVRHVLNANKGA